MIDSFGGTTIDTLNSIDELEEEGDTFLCLFYLLNLVIMQFMFNLIWSCVHTIFYVFDGTDIFLGRSKNQEDYAYM